jgi:hypothetical protein
MRRNTIGLLVTWAFGLLWLPLMATAQLAGKVWRNGGKVTLLTFPLCCFDHIACWPPRNTP